MTQDWRQPYRSQDESGSPEAAACVAWQWIEEVAQQVRSRSSDPAGLHIETYRVDGGGSVSALYQGTAVVAVATVFRDEMNFSVLIRWKAANNGA